MSEIAISVENLSKRYRIGQGARSRYGTLRDQLAGVFAVPWRRLAGRTTATGPSDVENTLWALRDVSFEIKRGEVVGIIGRNGAGKSTLLKVLSRITEPTAGRVMIRGRVGSLLEVGTGFHPELTGRENIFLNGAILGMRREEIARKFDEIVAFAEIEKFMDTPVKHYSSGMYTRLAFAVAAHLEPEILVLDEVLAVGDAQFQKKCLGKIGEVAREGRTVLFVSHNMTAVKSLCSQAILLKNGVVADRGAAHSVVTDYLCQETTNRLQQSWDNLYSAPGNDYVRVRSINVVPELRSDDNLITVETPLAIECEFWNLCPGACINLSLVLWTITGQCVFNVFSPSISLDQGLYKGICRIPANMLNDDTYSIEMYFVRDTSVVLYREATIAVFKIEDSSRSGAWFGKRVGVIRPNLEFSLGGIDCE